jgi:hypothetical protein
MQKRLSWQAILVWVSIYSIAMGLLESAVVIYLRTIYYPYGFDFPLAPIDKHIAVTEIGREAATLIMLISIGMIAGRTGIQRFAYFLYSFAIWDIFYYVFLRIFIGWPETLLTWDILFLIPITWVGPVIAPVMLSLSMIFLSLFIIISGGRNRSVSISGLAWVILLAGSIILILSFIWDYSSFLLERFSLHDLFKARNNEALFDLAFSYVPRKFNWWLFVSGELFIIGGIVLIINRKKKL